MILPNKRITKALIRLRVCAGWSAPVLFANLQRQVFSRRGPYILKAIKNATGTSVIFPINISLIHFVFVQTSVPNVGKHLTKT